MTDAVEHWQSAHVEVGGLAGVGCRSFGEPFNRWLYRLRRAVFMRRVAPLVEVRPDLAVLDVGSGTGFYLDLWRELGVRDLTGYDLAPAAVERLRARYPDVEVRRADIGAEDGLPARRFGVVSVFDVLFHILDDDRYAQAFRNLGALVEPGGLLVFTENFLKGDRSNAPTPSQVDRTEAEIAALLAENGFEPLLRQRMFVLMNEAQNAADPLRPLWWRGFRRASRHRPWVGAVAGPLLYPLERALVALPGKGSSSDLMVCRKVEHGRAATGPPP